MNNSKIHPVNKYSAENGLSRAVSYLSQFQPNEDIQRYQCTYDSLNAFLTELTECTSNLYSYLDTKGKLTVDEATLSKIRDNQLIRSRREPLKQEVSKGVPDAEDTVLSQPSLAAQDDVLTIRHSDLNLIISDVFSAVIKQLPQLQEKPIKASKKKSTTKQKEDNLKAVNTESHEIQGDVSDIPVPFDENNHQSEKITEEPEEKRRKFDGKKLWDDVDWYEKIDLPKNYTKDYKLIIHEINKGIQETYDTKSPIHDNVTELANMLDEYFSVRFAYNRHDGHKFYPELYKEYLSAFTIGYAHAIVKGDLDSFRDEFGTWINDVKSGKNKYSAPSSVGWVFRDLSNPKTATPDAYIDKNTIIVAQLLWGQIFDKNTVLNTRNKFYLKLKADWLPTLYFNKLYGKRMYSLLHRTLDDYDPDTFVQSNDEYSKLVCNKDDMLNGYKMIVNGAAA